MNPTQFTIEAWFKSDHIGSFSNEIILGLSPYKLRKKAGQPSIQIIYSDYSYCEMASLKGDTWYHFALSLSEEGAGSIACYLNGQPYSAGLAPVSLISSNVMKFKEISFGSSIDAKTSESKFNGYLKEFRWWKKVRNSFQISNFKNTYLEDLKDFNPPN